MTASSTLESGSILSLILENLSRGDRFERLRTLLIEGLMPPFVARFPLLLAETATNGAIGPPGGANRRWAVATIGGVGRWRQSALWRHEKKWRLDSKKTRVHCFN
eukprot:COSAG02_NODE_3971_length_5973_cov_5.170582_5_plen_104_part_01